MTALPGFIDAHRHVMSGNDDRWFKEQSVDRMREFLEAGYTTLMSGGGPFPGILELKRRVESGALKGPRIITSGRVDPDNFKTEELARAQVRKYAQAGIEIIKARIDPGAERRAEDDPGRRHRRGEEAQARRDGARRQRAGDARRSRRGRHQSSCTRLTAAG